MNYKKEKPAKSRFFFFIEPVSQLLNFYKLPKIYFT